METMLPLAAIILNFTIPQPIHKYLRADGIHWPIGPRALGPGPRTLKENAKRTVNENPKRTVNENTKITVNENAKRTLNENAKRNLEIERKKNRE